MIFEDASDRPGALLILLALAAAEYLWRVHRAGKGYDVRAAFASIGVMVGNMLTKPLGALVMAAAFSATAAIAPWQFAVDDWRTWAIGFLAVEFAYYWHHRLNHEKRWMWASHAVHHSASEFTLPAAVRLGWTGLFSLAWLLFLPLVLIGFPPLVVGALLAANLLYQYLLHTEAIGRLGPLEAIFNTPSHHRAHHSSDREFLDCNFGGVLIVFDRLFGTFRREPEGGGLTYGLVEPLASHNPFVIALHEWARLAHDLRHAPIGAWPRLMFGRPGNLALKAVPSKHSKIPADLRPAEAPPGSLFIPKRAAPALNPIEETMP